MDSVRIAVNESSAQGAELSFFVVTGSKRPPIVCMADNNGFPYVRDIYAKGGEHQRKKGVFVNVRFEQEVENKVAEGTGVAVNIMQPDMEGDYTVIPL